MYGLEIKPTVDKIFRKLAKKNPKQLKIIAKKITEIRKNPLHKYKHLRKPLEDFYRVHIDKNFVLIFDIDHLEEVIIIYYFDHHDNVYEWKPKKAEE
jgi:YafQ family addiction module toxin component